MAVPDLDTLLRTIDPASDGQRVARRMRSSMQSWCDFLRPTVMWAHAAH